VLTRRSGAVLALGRNAGGGFFVCAGRVYGQIGGVAKMQAIQAEVVPSHTPALFRVAVRRAAEMLRAGELVALPTETVYGLAANAGDAAAVARIFEVKGRPAHNPIIVHVASLEMAKRCVADWPVLADRLAAAFWPGPLTLVLPRGKEIPGIVTAGGATVGIRWPSHPLIQAVIQECGFPLAAPSANPANRLSPTMAEHVRKHLGGKIRLIIDGGRAQVGIESTVLDISTSPPRVLRPGLVHEQALLAVTRKLATGAGPNPEILRSPGLLPRHYSPQAKLEIWAWRDEEDLRARRARSGVRGSRVHLVAHTRIPAGAGLGRVSVIPREAAAFARALYAELHEGDAAGAELIVVEAPPEGPEWRAIADRLRRAAG